MFSLNEKEQETYENKKRVLKEFAEIYRNI